MSSKKLLYNLATEIDGTGMKRQKKKSPSDYPQMAFRISNEDKQKLSDLIDDVHQLANKSIVEGEKKTKKNELIVAALFNGLQSLRKKHLS